MSNLKEITTRLLPPKEADIVCAVWDAAMRQLDHSPRFAYYTLHGSLHHSSLLQNLSILIEGGIKLTQRELYLLLLAICAHDLGMVLPMSSYSFNQISEGRPGVIDLSSFENFVRDVHHEVITKHFENELTFLTNLGVTLPDLAVIAEIGKAHRKIKLRDQRDTVKKLGALLRIIDELDIGPSRAPIPSFLQRVDEMDGVSTWHWYKHIITEPWTVGNNVSYTSENGKNRITFTTAVHPQEPNRVAYWLTQISRPIRRALDDEQCQSIIEEEFGVKIILHKSDSLSNALPLGERWKDIENKALGQGQINVLVVDDEMRRIEDLFLPLMEHCIVQCAPRVKTALEYLAAKKFDLVILDMQMPADGLWSATETNDHRLTGLFVAKKLRTEYPDLLVVGLTGIKHPLPEESNEIFDIIIRKPVDSLDLRDEVLSLIQDNNEP